MNCYNSLTSQTRAPVNWPMSIFDVEFYFTVTSQIRGPVNWPIAL